MPMSVKMTKRSVNMDDLDRQMLTLLAGQNQPHLQTIEVENESMPEICFEDEATMAYFSDVDCDKSFVEVKAAC